MLSLKLKLILPHQLLGPRVGCEREKGEQGKEEGKVAPNKPQLVNSKRLNKCKKERLKYVKQQRSKKLNWADWKKDISQSVGFEPTLPEGIWFLVRRLNHSATTAARCERRIVSVVRLLKRNTRVSPYWHIPVVFALLQQPLKHLAITWGVIQFPHCFSSSFFKWLKWRH